MDIRNLIGSEFLNNGKEFKVTDIKVEDSKIILMTEELTSVPKETENPKYSFSQTSLDKMKKVHPKLVEVMKAAIENSPFDFRITDGARTTEEQFALYQQGRTVLYDKKGKKLKKVTNCDGKTFKSNHQLKSDGYGHAVDIFPCGVIENGVYRKFTSEEGYDDKKLKLIADHILTVAKSKKINIEWGGNWKMHDTPHFELK